jgi:hypothetical protein
MQLFFPLLQTLAESLSIRKGFAHSFANWHLVALAPVPASQTAWATITSNFAQG